MTDPYLGIVARLEPDIHPIDGGGAYASIAISLKRIADVADRLNDFMTPFTAEAIAKRLAQVIVETRGQAIAEALDEAMTDAREQALADARIKPTKPGAH